MIKKQLIISQTKILNNNLYIRKFNSFHVETSINEIWAYIWDLRTLCELYGIYHWRVLWSSYRKMARVGFEPATTEFHSDTLTNWAIRSWIWFALRANSLLWGATSRPYNFCIDALPTKLASLTQVWYSTVDVDTRSDIESKQTNFGWLLAAGQVRAPIWGNFISLIYLQPHAVLS